MAASTMSNVRLVEIKDVVDANKFVLKIILDSEKEMDQRYLNMEMNLTEEWKKRVKSHHDASAQSRRSVGDHVMVKSSQWNGIRRGVIISKFLVSNDDFSYTIFLYDHGISMERSNRTIAMLDKVNVAKLAPRTVKVTIPGIVPARKLHDLKSAALGEQSKPTYAMGNHWTPMCRNFVTGWIKQATAIYLETKKVKLDGSILGDLHCENVGDGQGSLGTILVRSNWAIHSDYMLKCQLNDNGFMADLKGEPNFTVSETNQLDTTRSLNEIVDFEEQVRQAEIVLNDDRKPTSAYNENLETTLEEDSRIRKLNRNSFIFNSQHRLTTLSEACKGDSISTTRRPEKVWLHNDHNDKLKWQRKRLSTDDETVAPCISPSQPTTLSTSRLVSVGRGRARTAKEPLSVIAKINSSTELNSEENCAPSSVQVSRNTTEIYGGYGRGRGAGFNKRKEPFIIAQRSIHIETDPANVLEGIQLVSDTDETVNTNKQSSEKLATIIPLDAHMNTDFDTKVSVGELSPNENQETITKLVDRKDPRVAYGCISIGDVPGRTLVRGSMLMPPLSNISKFMYYDRMKQPLLNAGIEEMNVLQKSVAPHFMRGDDCFIIGGRGCGKSMSYLIPMVGTLDREFSMESFHKDATSAHIKGPLCIIACHEFKSALKIEGHLHHLVANRLVVALVCDDQKDTWAKCAVGIDIMVTTLSFAVNMLNRCHSHFKFDRMRYFIFDDADVMMRSSEEDFDKIRTAAESFVMKNPNRQPFQRVICGHEWNDEMEKLYFKLPGFLDPKIPVLPTLHIQSRNQAIRYSRMKWHIHSVLDEDKIHKIIGLLKSSVETVQHRNIFIVCSTPELAFEVHTELDEQGIVSCLAHMDSMSTDDVVRLTKQWDNFPDVRRIMVLHDAILRSLMLYNVTCLIHYDLPIKVPQIKSSAGADRFSCMWGFFRDISDEKENFSRKYQRQELVSHFLLNGTEKELYKLKLFAHKMGVQMPDNLSKSADEIGNLELDKKPMCSGIKLYGKCMEPVPENCLLRHKFRLDELQEPPTMARSGEIEVRITNCVNPSYYIGQVIRYYELKDKRKILKSNLINLFNERSKKLDVYFQIESNRIEPPSFETGKYCAVVAPLVGFTRAKIEKVMTRTTMNFPKTVRVFCVDHGEYLQPRAEDLFALPPGYDELPNLAVNIILANLKPPEGAIEYRSHQIQQAKKMISEKILHGKIHLSIGDTVWINPLVEMHKDPFSQQAVKGQSIRMELIKRKYAENNDFHTETLIEICKSVGFTCPEFQQQEQHLLADDALMSTFFHIGNEVQWAFMPRCSLADPNPVDMWTSFTKDPYNIFGTMDKFDQQLDELILDLNAYITEMIGERCKEYATQFELFYEKGLVVAVKDPVEQRWLRGIITDLYEQDGKSLFNVFLVDVGEEQFGAGMNDIFPIPYYLVTRLPFQAIALELAHIKPTGSSETQSWNEEAIDRVIDLTLDDNKDSRKVNVMAVESKMHHMFGCRYYTAMILLDSGDEIGEVLANQNLAIFVGKGLEIINKIKDKLLVKYNAMYDNREVASDDDDDEGENDLKNFDFGAPLGDESLDEWDVQGFDPTDIKNAMGLNSSYQGDKAPDSGIINNAISNMKIDTIERCKGIICPKQGFPSTQIKEKYDEPVVPPSPLFSDLLHPKVLWRQTKNQLILTVDHPDIRSYTLSIERKNVSFRTKEPLGYGFDILCFGRVLEKADEFLTGQYLRIKLNKLVKNNKWPHPLEAVLKAQWFKEDLENVHSSDEEDFNEEKMLSKTHVNFQEEYDDDESLDSDDDDPERTEEIGVVDG